MTQSNDGGHCRWTRAKSSWSRRFWPVPETLSKERLRIIPETITDRHKKLLSMLPRSRSLTDRDLRKFTKWLPHFRDVFMRDELPSYASPYECAIVNLDSGHGLGTHWVAYSKKANSIYYYDSFGNLPPPKELIEYFIGRGGGGATNNDENINIFYNYKRNQSYNEFNCRHLCLKFLYDIF